MNLFRKEFKQGDRVIAKCEGERYHGVTGTIIEPASSLNKAYIVEFDEYVNGFSYAGKCAYGHGRTVPVKALKRLRNDPQKVSEKELMKIINKK